MANPNQPLDPAAISDCGLSIGQLQAMSPVHSLNRTAAIDGGAPVTPVSPSGSRIAKDLLGDLGLSEPSTDTNDRRTSRPTGLEYLNNPVKPHSGVESFLHNQQLPSVLIKHSKVEHRIMLYMKAQGASNREVAEALDYSDAQVSQITRQPWFMHDLKDLLETLGEDLVRTVLKGAALDSVMTLINVRDNAKTPATVQVTAANSLLDRFFGKPKTSVDVNHTSGKQPTPADQAAIDREIEQLARREQEIYQSKRSLENQEQPGL